MADLRKFHKFMAEFVPMLVKQKQEEERVRRWLEKSLKEYEAYGAQQSKLAEQGFQYDVLLQLLKSAAKGTEASDRPGLELLRRLQTMGAAEKYPGLPTITGEQYETTMKPYGDLGAALASAVKEAAYPEEETAIAATRLKGLDFLKEYHDLLEKVTTGKEQMEMRGRELEEKTAGRELAEKELGVRKEELEVEKGKQKGKKTPKELKKELNTKVKERNSFIEKYFKGPYGSTMEEKIKKVQDPFLLAQVERLTEDINKLREQTGFKIPEKYREIVSYLKSKGCTIERLLKDEALQADIKSLGFSVFRILDYY